MSVHSSEDSRGGILEGARKLAKICESVLGPAARTVAFSTGKHAPFVSQDGCAIVREVYLPDQMENLGADLIRSASQKTNDAAGDGTTTTSILTYAIMVGVGRALAAGIKPHAIAKSLEFYKEKVLEHLKGSVVMLETEEDIKAVATASANDEHIGGLIAEAISKIGKDGMFSAEESYTGETYLEVEMGSIAEGGYFIPEYGGSDTEIIVENAYLLLTDETIDSPKALNGIISTVQKSKKTLVTLSGGIHSTVSAMLRDCRKKGFQVYAAKAPLFGEKRLDYLEDLATLTGGIVFSRKNGIDYKQADINLLGRAQKVRLRQDKTIIYGGEGSDDRILSRVKGLRTSIATAPTGYEKERLRERLARLTGGIAVIKLGGSRFNQRLSKYRVEDAVRAVQSAMDEGILPGGGASLLRAAYSLVPDKTAESKWVVNILKEAFETPFRAILGGDRSIDQSMIIHQLVRASSNTVYNAKTRVIENYRTSNVVDPYKVTRLAVENSVSMGKMLAVSGGVSLRPIHEVNVVNSNYKGPRPKQYFQR